MNCYMMTWNIADASGAVVSAKSITDAFDNNSNIVNWRSSTGAIFLVSEQESRAISEGIRGALPSLLFIVVPIKIESLWGWTDKETWEFIRIPKRANEL